MNANKYILGISAGFHDSAAALVLNNNILAAVQEERFTRKKSDASFPDNSVSYCLSLIPKDKKLSAVCFYENPILKLDRIYKEAVLNYPCGAPLWMQILKTTHFLNKLPQKLHSILNDPSNIFFSEHHLSHAASAFFPSGFHDSAILVVDGVGEKRTTSIFHGQNGSITPVKAISFPHSLGLLYSAFTQYCGFKVNSGEYKLMGLAPFGEPKYKNRILENLIAIKSDGSFKLNMDYFSFRTERSTINQMFEGLFGREARKKNGTITRFYRDMAASAQAVIQEAMVALSKTALAVTGSNNLCLAGGVGLNCVSNSYIKTSVKELKGLWIQPASGDAGGALGAALLLSRQVCPSGHTTMSPYLGPEYADETIMSDLSKHGLNYHTFPDLTELNNKLADHLAEGMIAGYFQGRLEYGPRALGNRSIIADPRPDNTLSRTNQKIKFREPWRPFAPTIMEEHAKDIFIRGDISPHMTLIDIIRPELRKEIDPKALLKQERSLVNIMSKSFSCYSAITHCDYTSRLQTVNASQNPHWHQLLSFFHDRTGCPLLLNTSFNIRGEPIVCTPEDAIKCFLNTNMDILAIGNFLIIKDEQSEKNKARVGRIHFNAD